MNVADEVNEIFEKMPQVFVPENAAGINATIQLKLTGEGGGDWQLKIANGQINVEQGETSAADLTLELSAKDYVAVSTGKTNPMTLFMGGKIKAQGNMSLAMKFNELFDRNRAT